MTDVKYQRLRGLMERRLCSLTFNDSEHPKDPAVSEGDTIAASELCDVLAAFDAGEGEEFIERKERFGRSDQPLKNDEAQGDAVPNAGSGHQKRGEARSVQSALSAGDVDPAFAELLRSMEGIYPEVRLTRTKSMIARAFDAGARCASHRGRPLEGSQA